MLRGRAFDVKFTVRSRGCSELCAFHDDGYSGQRMSFFVLYGAFDRDFFRFGWSRELRVTADDDSLS